MFLRLGPALFITRKNHVTMGMTMRELSHGDHEWQPHDFSMTPALCSLVFAGEEQVPCLGTFSLKSSIRACGHLECLWQKTGLGR